MRRRTFIGSVAGLGGLVPMEGAAEPPVPAAGGLGGMDLPQMRQRYHDELFGNLLPFWDKHGIDHQYGGVMHALDYDGTVVDSNKLSWFQGRAIWIYSFLYNRFEQNPAYLEIARKTQDFLLMNAPQPDGWWAEEFSRDGKVVKPFSGDLYGMYFAAEGLQEYAWAARDEQARDLAIALMKKLYRRIQEPDFLDRKSTRLNSSHANISYAVFCLKKK